MAVEVVAGVLVAALAIASVVAAFIGLAGVIGVIRFVHCEHCGRLSLSTTAEALASCVNCRHERILHPVALLHRARASHHTHGHAA